MLRNQGNKMTYQAFEFLLIKIKANLKKNLWSLPNYNNVDGQCLFKYLQFSCFYLQTLLSLLLPKIYECTLKY
jgi:hypothetical protein